MIGVLMSSEGIPIGCEVFPGSFQDMRTLKVALNTLSSRFKIGKVILVADRGMVSEKNLSLIKDEGYEYIVGMKMRKLKKVRDHILSTPGRYKKLENNLKVKEVGLDNVRYIICYNPQEAERDKKIREKIIQNLEEKIRTSTLSRVLTGDARKFCKVETKGVTLNKEKIKKEARYDGKYVLQTTTSLPSDEIVGAYKRLWMIEYAFRDIKNIFKIRPVFHWTPQRVKGHIFICFLAFLLTTSLQKKLLEKGVKENVWKVIRDVKRVKTVTLYVKDQVYLLRTDLKGLAHEAFRAVSLRVPSQVQKL